MKQWLRLTLVTVTIGGGFTGVALTLQALLSAKEQSPFGYVLILVFLALFAFVTVSGVMFVHDPNQTSLLIASLALQIPWVSSPICAYKFAAGFQLCGALMGGRFSGGIRLGSDFQINLFQRLPWGIGVNFFALALLILLLRATRTPDNPVPPTPDAGGGPVVDRLPDENDALANQSSASLAGYRRCLVGFRLHGLAIRSRAPDATQLHASGLRSPSPGGEGRGEGGRF
jgi:hypothetical protein